MNMMFTFTTWLIGGVGIPEQMKDRRDRDAFPDFEGGSLPFEQHLPKAGTSIEPNVSPNSLDS